ncbi:Disease resistance protein [Musa troglodytarum]|uniref:Disease resistance protein n=1 Tax=Musa troglodytarum TaxID=320322 RepID=A0A9E7KL32_9LILI|nr:Disease resistance protein [Musa troglodytarum]
MIFHHARSFLLGLLPELKFLSINGANAIITIGAEFLSDRRSLQGFRAFPKLEVMQFFNMPNWTKWSTSVTSVQKKATLKLLQRSAKIRRATPDSRPDPSQPRSELDLIGSQDIHFTNSDLSHHQNPVRLPTSESAADDSRRSSHLKLLPNLKELWLVDCPKLRALSEGLCPTNLKLLHMEGTHSFVEIKNLDFLTDNLTLKHNHSLRRISNLPSLKHLQVDDCPNLQYVGDLAGLQRLHLSCPPPAQRLPLWLSDLAEQQRSFRKLELQCSLPLLKRCLMGEVNWEIIRQIPEVRIRATDANAYIWYNSDPYMYDTNGALQQLTSSLLSSSPFPMVSNPCNISILYSQGRVLTNGIEVKLQRNALSVIEAPTGHEDDDETECDNMQWNGSDMVSDDMQLQKPHKSRVRHHKGSSNKSWSRSLSCDSHSKGSVTSSRSTTVDASPNPSKEQLIDVVQRHFMSQASLVFSCARICNNKFYQKNRKG